MRPRPFPLMFRKFLFVFSVILLPASVWGAGTPADNPHTAFVRSWLDSPEKAGTHISPAVRFPFQEVLQKALRDQDRELVRALLPLYANAEESEIQITSMELAVHRQLAESAKQTASRLSELVNALEGRPAAGTAGQIEREALAAASLPFEAAAAESLAKIPALQRRLIILGVPTDTPIPKLSAPPVPASTDAASLAAASPLVRIFDLLADRSLSPLEVPDPAASTLGLPFSAEGDELASAIVVLGQQNRNSHKTRDQFRQVNAQVLTEAIQRRLDAIASLRALLNSLPEEKFERMAAAADLADRQYRQGAIPPGLLIETQNVVFEARKTRLFALLRLWRESLDLRSLTRIR